MASSPYRRGAPVLGVGAAILVLGGVGVARGSRERPPYIDPAPTPSPASADDASNEPSPVPTASSAYRRAITIPVITEPPGASVYAVDQGRHALLCAPTPCTITVPPDRIESGIVSLELGGHASAQAHVKDVADVPGGSLSLTFGRQNGAAGDAADPLGRPRTFPRVRQGAVKLDGGGKLPVEVVTRIARQNFGRFRLCYENGLRTNPNLQGRVVTKFVIDRSGAVSTAQDGGSDLPDQNVVSCIVRSFASLAFPEPEGSIVWVTFPISFSANEP